MRHPLAESPSQVFLKPVADAVRRSLATAPANLIEIVGRLDAYQLAAIALSRIMDDVLWGFKDDDYQSKRPVYQAVGQHLKDRLEFAEINVAKAIDKQIKSGRPRAENFLREEWPTGHLVLAGWWLVERAIESGYFQWHGQQINHRAGIRGPIQKASCGAAVGRTLLHAALTPAVGLERLAQAL